MRELISELEDDCIYDGIGRELISEAKDEAQADKKSTIATRVLLGMSNAVYGILKKVSQQVREINASEGDYKKISDGKIHKVAVNVGELLEMHKNDRNLQNLPSVQTFRYCVAVLESERKYFMKSYKDKNELVQNIYIAFCVYLILACENITTYVYSTTVGVAIGKDAESQKKFNTFNDTFGKEKEADIKKVIRNEVGVSKLSESIQYESDNVQFYGEATTVTFMNMVGYGLSRILYKVMGVVRLAIYFLYVCGYSLQNRIQTTREMITYFKENDESKREVIAKKLDEEIQAIKMDDVKSNREVTRMVEADKQDITEKDIEF